MLTTEPILVKRYARSRLYDPDRTRYAAIGELRRWQTKGVAFIVREADSGDDITRVVLA